MPQSNRVWVLLVLGAAPLLGVQTSCAPAPEPERRVGQSVSALSAQERQTRAAGIRDAAAAVGLSNGLLLAGIAQGETGLAHCWSEATWACQGPASSSCGGGPVIAGAGDGPCNLMQGGLGMFQFDAGTYDQTLAREGDRVLTVEGNTQAAVDFVVAMVIRSQFIPGVDTRDQALAWMNAVRVDDANYPIWIKTVTSYYNGCFEGQCSVYNQRYQHYDDATRTMLTEMGEPFWYDGVVVPMCEPLPPEGGIIEEDNRCFEGGGNPMYLRHAQAGHDGALIWTHATDDPDAANFGRWHLLFSEGGNYTLEVFTDAAFAQSKMTRYTIQHADGMTDVVIDQTAVNGFQSLGMFRFEAGTMHEVFSGDNTGEPGSGNTQIVYDALQVTRVPSAMPDAGPVDAGTPRDLGGNEDLGSPVRDVGGGRPDLPPAAVDMGKKPVVIAGHACNAAVEHTGSIPAFALLIALVLLLRRQARRS